MCNRTKTEILARELAIEYFRGLKHNKVRNSSELRVFVDLSWIEWVKQANIILATLKKHED